MKKTYVVREADFGVDIKSPAFSGWSRVLARFDSARDARARALELNRERTRWILDRPDRWTWNHEDKADAVRAELGRWFPEEVKRARGKGGNLLHTARSRF